MASIADTSPRLTARMAGAFQLLEAATATFGGVIVPGRLVVAGSAAATAARILGGERLFWLGFASSLVGVVFHAAWALLMYELLRPVNRSVSLLAVFIILVGCAVQAVTSLFYVAAWVILQGGPSVSAFTRDELQALALLFLKVGNYAFDIYLVFFGLWCLIIGYLVFKSTFLPRVLGVLLSISGLGWMTYLYPPLAYRLFVPFIVAASAIGEVPLELWLLVMGVNVSRWQEQANTARR
jgi:Domain of unknown function (DUF4386)